MSFSDNARREAEDMEMKNEEEDSETILRSSVEDWDSNKTVSALVTHPEHARQSERAIPATEDEVSCFDETDLITDDFFLG